MVPSQPEVAFGEESTQEVFCLEIEPRNDRRWVRHINDQCSVQKITRLVCETKQIKELVTNCSAIYGHVVCVCVN